MRSTAVRAEYTEFTLFREQNNIRPNYSFSLHAERYAKTKSCSIQAWQPANRTHPSRYGNIHIPSYRQKSKPNIFCYSFALNDCTYVQNGWIIKQSAPSCVTVCVSEGIVRAVSLHS